MGNEERILCSQCGKDLAMKFIELKDLVFCSNQCLEAFKNSMGEKKFYREYGDVFLPGEGKGWVPVQSNEFIQMCIRCPAKMTEVCQSELEISGVFHDAVAESETIRWCCHARFILSCAFSDGTVPYELVKKIQSHAEGLTKTFGLIGVTTITLNMTFADLARKFNYQRLPERLPEIKPLNMSHFGACLLCDPAFGKQCEAQANEEFKLTDRAKAQVKNLWCAHAVQCLADVLIDRENGEDLVRKIIPLAEKVAEEKGHPGVIVRDYFIAMGRSIG
jgi:hypothetical protein